MSALTEYLQLTSGVRKQGALFLSYHRPHDPVTKDTIARWCKHIMINSGIDPQQYVTHSCRAAASSKAAKRVPIRKLLDSCGWASEATFASHYRKNIVLDKEVGESLLV